MNNITINKLPAEYDRKTLLEHLLKCLNGYEYDKAMKFLRKKCEVSDSAISKWRNDRVNIPTKHQIIIADYFKISIDKLLLREKVRA